MATAKQVDQLLAQAHEELRRLGAHGLCVESGKELGVRGSVIRAWVEPGAAVRLPSEIKGTVGGKQITVPIRVEVHERMKPEL
jgi:hypothetical protein